MKLTFIKKSITSVISCALLLVFVPPVSTFAALEDIRKLGGCYGDLQYEKDQYLEDHPDDATEYECHHLIAKEALNQWGGKVRRSYGVKKRNGFLTSDPWQNWAPSITMEKADHKKTLNYMDQYSTPEQKLQAELYIDKQARRIIYQGDIMGVLINEINFICDTFGDKYNRAIDEVWGYIHYLNFDTGNKTTLTMRHPSDYHWYFEYDFSEEKFPYLLSNFAV